MMITTLKTQTHRTIAHIEVDARGLHTILDSDHKVLGTYDPRTNRTRDRTHKTVGYGYQLPRLLSGSLAEEGVASPSSNLDKVQRKAERRADLSQQMTDERTRSSQKLQKLQKRLSDQ